MHIDWYFVIYSGVHRLKLEKMEKVKRKILAQRLQVKAQEEAKRQEEVLC